MSPSNIVRLQQQVDDPHRPFRIIIVGGGVAGLTISHCLHKAGIEHVVLERRSEIAPAEGASIAIYPHGARILHQLGCLEAAQKVCVPCDRFYSRSSDGSTLNDNGFFHHVRENHGIDILLFERRKFLSLLHAAHPDKSRVRTDCEVVEIRQSPSGVQVTLGDGSVEVGDMVIGADGVHSAVRSLMWTHSNLTQPGSITVAEKTRLRTQWKCLVGMAPATLELGERNMTAVHNVGFSFLALTQPDATFFFVFFKLAPHEQYRWPRRAPRWSPADADDLAAEVADRAVSPTLVFGELWARRLRGGIIPVEEGVLQKWHSGRIVLVGDAAHKVTPNIALGGNTGMESAVVLTNHLHAMMRRQQGARPSLHTLSRALQGYQEDQQARAVAILQFSALITKLQAWDTRLYRFVATWVMPHLPDRTIADQMAGMIRTAPCLDFAPLTGFPIGRVAWAEHTDKESVMDKKAQKGSLWFSGWMSRVGGLLTLFILAYSSFCLLPLSKALGLSEPAPNVTVRVY